MTNTSFGNFIKMSICYLLGFDDLLENEDYTLLSLWAEFLFSVDLLSDFVAADAAAGPERGAQAPLPLVALITRRGC